MGRRYKTLKLTITRSKNSVCFYVQKTIRRADGKPTTVTVEKLGNLDAVRTRASGKDPYQWAKDYVEELNHREYDEQKEIIVSYSPQKLIKSEEQHAFNCGYLFLQDIYYSLKMDKICKAIEKRHDFQYDLNEILSRLVYGRILYPASKLSTVQSSAKLLEQPSFAVEDVYRALSVLSEENDFIQSELYKNSQKIIGHRKDILYYDTTNYYFEIEIDDDLRRYGKSKENRPNPIVGMGLFTDSDGIPLACTVFPGSNERPTLLPLEKKIIKDFGMENLVVCTDAGLADNANRKFNDLDLPNASRKFITVQSLKQIRADLQEWALDTEGWHLIGDDRTYCLNDLDEEKDKDRIFYKEKWFTEDLSAKRRKQGVKPLEQRLIVSYSIKYRDYLRSVRDGQVRRAEKMVESRKEQRGNHQNDPRRFVKHQGVTEDGEICPSDVTSVDREKIAAEEKYDGFYAVCTNLDKLPIGEVIRINKRRWQIEECFRIMKSDFKARPVYLQRQDRIKAHFLTCFIALFIYRILEKKLNKEFSCEELLDTLRGMDLCKVPDNAGYTPVYTRTAITDALHEAFGFRTDYEIMTGRSVRTLISRSKK